MDTLTTFSSLFQVQADTTELSNFLELMTMWSIVGNQYCSLV